MNKDCVVTSYFFRGYFMGKFCECFPGEDYIYKRENILKRINMLALRLSLHSFVSGTFGACQCV